jgi:hypothetical protein
MEELSSKKLKKHRVFYPPKKETVMTKNINRRRLRRGM